MRVSPKLANCASESRGYVQKFYREVGIGAMSRRGCAAHGKNELRGSYFLPRLTLA
jgi:hypothetical protein